MNRLRIVSRGSDLARAQTTMVKGLLAARHPGLEIEVTIVRSHGDRDRTTPLIAMGGVGVFVKELQQVMLKGDADAAVHSLKDLPTMPVDGLEVAAVLAREAPNDVLISRDQLRLSELPHGATIATASPRRRAQLRAQRADLVFVEVRGNVDTRLRKLREGQFDALVLALAGLRRVGLADQVTEILTSEIMLPAPGQGAIAIEVTTGTGAADLVAPLNDRWTHEAVAAERSFLLALGGGCAVPVAALATVSNGGILLDGLVADPATGEVVRHQASGSDPITTGRQLAEIVRDGGGARILSAVVPSRPLANRRVVVTRPEDRSDELRRRLEEQQAEVVACPAIEVLPVQDTLQLDAAIRSIDDVEIVAVTSATAVAAVVEVMQRLGRRPSEVRTPFAAVGPATADALRSHGLTVTLVAKSTSGEGLAASIASVTHAGARVLLPRAAEADPRLPLALRRAGFDLTEVVAYRVAPRRDLPTALATAFACPVDWLVFTSPSAVRAVVAAAAVSGVELQGVKIACIGPTTSAAVTESSLTTTVSARQARIEELVGIMVRSELEGAS